MTRALSPQDERAGSDEYALPIPPDRRIGNAIFGCVGSDPEGVPRQLLQKKLGSRSRLSRAGDLWAQAGGRRLAQKTWGDSLQWSEDMEISTADRRDRQAGRIIVYDDDRLLLDVLVTMLRREGHQVTATQSEQEAIALARAQHFDLAVVDLGRQRSKGYDLVVTISATSPETPVLAMSAYPAREVVRFAQEHAQAFLEKPFSLAELVDVARSILTQGERARETVRADCPAALRVRVPAVGSGA